MPRLKTRAAKDSLLRRMRKQRLKYIAILPSLITTLNGVCGFAAIVFAGKDAFVVAGYMLLLAMIADMLDGRIARMSQRTSSFGGQLDSLCDMVSFGIAPAYLMLKVLDYKFGFTNLNETFESFLQRSIWLTAAAYICCAAIRLARFNVENEEGESTHTSFVGLPAPAAAGVIVSLVIFYQKSLPLSSESNIVIYRIGENIIIGALPVLSLGVAILMVSRIQYPHVLNQYASGKKPFAHLIKALLLIGFIFWIGNFQTALVVIFCGFAASGFVKYLYYKTSRTKKVEQKNEFLATDQQNAANYGENG